MDPYSLCPCGSGKKVKFCCQKLLPEMEKIERLQENQPEQALVNLDRLEQSSPNNPWIVTTRAGTLMQQGEFAAAKLALLRFLKEHSDHPRANALYAFASFHADGYPASKKAVHRAFKRCVEESPRIVSALMESLAGHHLGKNNLLAGRAHLMLALRISSHEEDRDRVIRTIMQFDSDTATPFLLRGGLRIPQYQPAPVHEENFNKARHLSLLACWEEAADLLDQIAAEDTQSPELFHMLGLFRAWDGADEAAAVALHKAAGLYQDTNAAIECETLAQFLDRAHTDRVQKMRVIRYEATSVSQLLSRLDEDPRFARTDAEEQSRGGEGDPVAMYLFLDRALPGKETLADLSDETVPLYLGRVLVFDGSPADDLKPVVFISGLEGEQLAATEEAVKQIAGTLVSPKPIEANDTAEGETVDDTKERLEVLGEIPVDELPLHRNYYIPPGTPSPLRQAIQERHWQRIQDDLWPGTPQAVLGGKTPLQAADDPGQRLALEAALNLFEAFADSRNRILPLDELRVRLKLGARDRLELGEEHAAGGLSNFDLNRLDLTRLKTEDVEELIGRLRMSAHPRLLYEAAQEWIRRDVPPPPEGEEPRLTLDAVYGLLTALAAQLGRAEEALQWAEKGRDLPVEPEGRFEHQLNWKLRELRVRTQFYAAEELRTLLQDLWENFAVKIPNLRAQLQQVVTALGIDPPWESSIVTAGSAWSPASPASGGEAAKSLWLPGQD